jgi:hypothetical protein
LLRSAGDRAFRDAASRSRRCSAPPRIQENGLESEENLVVTLVKSMNEIAHANVKIIERMNETGRQIAELEHAVSQAQDGLRVAVSFLAMALMKQEAIDRGRLAADFSELVDATFDTREVPQQVTDMRALLSRVAEAI